MKSDSASSVSLEPSPPPTSIPDQAPAQPHTIRNGLLCSLVFAACFWISWPVAQMGFVDDWSYIKSAQVFAQTGHFVYNGWATAMLGWQLVWGAVFIRLFGFSFMAVKLSTFPLACVCVFLFYLIQIRFGIRPANAVFGTLTLGLSPLFLPLAASFMSDIPGLFVILLCLYCCQRSIAASTDRAAIAWLCFAAASNIAGGTCRQIAWLGALVMVPCTAWLLRKRRGMLLTAVVLWIATIASILYCMHWFARQPYSISEGLFTYASSAVNSFFIGLLLLAGEFFCLLLMMFPLTIAWLPCIRTARGIPLVIGAGIVLLWIRLQMLAHWTLPWVPHLLVSEFAVPVVAQMRGYRGPFIFPQWACLVLSAFVLAAFLLLLGSIRAHFRATQDFPRSVLNDPAFWLLIPYSFSYCVLLFVHSLQDGSTFDRYLLGLMPVATILLIRLYEVRIAPSLPATCIVTGALFALLAIAGTHDWFAWQRSRLTAIAELRSAGISRTQIQGGFEYDGWTQVETDGYVNEKRIKIPPGAYHANAYLPPVDKACMLDFSPWTPAIHPAYTVAFPPRPCLVPSKYAPVEYLAWLPPFRRSVYIQQVSAPRK
jgi:hypothetical protein